MISLPPLWPSQERGIQQVKDADALGEKAIVVTAPTGGGKTRMMAELAAYAHERCWAAGLYTSRRILTDQADKALQSLGVSHGMMAAGYDERLLKNIQVCSLQTIHRRALATQKWELPRFRLVLVDEAHSNKGDVAQEIILRHKEQGALIVGFTATPVNIGHLYDKLIVAGTKAELRQRGAIVRCDVFAPDEPDLKGVKKTQVGEYEYEGQVKKLMQTIVFANVFEQWKTLNPDGRPTILFAPGVPESRWFVEQWAKQGVAAFHIDADTPDSERAQAFADSRCGDLEVICSQGVMREGVDLPWLSHGILCQPCNNLTTYLQIGGRLLRAYPGKDKAIMQDHAGAWHRHGSLNEDRDWKLNDTDKSIRQERDWSFTNDGGAEPIRCPACGGIRKAGPRCPHCGHEHKMSVRLVRMTDGTLNAVRGNVHKKKRQLAAGVREWQGVLFALARAKKPATVSQAAAWFKRKHGYDVPAEVPGVPRAGSLDWNRLVTDLYPYTAKGAKDGARS